MPTCYIAHPIDRAHGRDLTIKGQRAAALLAERDWDSYHPAGAWMTGRATMPGPALQTVNRYALQHCDALLAIWPAGVPSHGTGIEIGEAGTLGLPVSVVTDRAGYALAGTPYVTVYDDLDRAVDELHPKSRLATKTARYDGPGQEPSRAHDDDAGYDLYSTAAYTIQPGDECMIPSGVAIQWPDQMWGLLVGRSSTFKRGLMVNTAIIDAGYRGDLFACVRNITSGTIIVNPGERIAQIIPMQTESIGIQLQKGTLDDSARGANGFGSSGR